MWNFLKTHKKKVVVGCAVFLCIISVFIFLGGTDISDKIHALLGDSNSMYDGFLAPKISEGIAMLKASGNLLYETVDGRADGVLSRRQIALAIFDRKKERLFEKRIWISEGDISHATSYSTIDSLSEKNDGIDVKIMWWNSFNSVYEIIDHPEMIVVANKYLIFRDVVPEQAFATLDSQTNKSKYVDIVYAPYSEVLHWPDVVEVGKTYIDDRIDEALEELKKAKVYSSSYPDKFVADVISPDLVKNIILSENVDPNWLALTDDGGKSLTERFFVIIGANQEWAYRYTKSHAGAYGLAQFIEPTYNSIRIRYPDAGLIKDHRLGMADHTNALKAVVLLLDNDRNHIEERVSGKNDNISDSMLAAAYNGGPKHVIDAINSNGVAWDESNHLPNETRQYVKKFRIIASLFSVIE